MLTMYSAEDRPNKDDIHTVLQMAARAASEHLGRGDAFSCMLEPGDATHYEAFGVRKDRHHMLVGFMAGTDRGAAGILPTDVLLHWSYVKQTLGLDNAHTAQIATDFLNLLFAYGRGGGWVMSKLKKERDALRTALEAHCVCEEGRRCAYCSILAEGGRDV